MKLLSMALGCAGLFYACAGSADSISLDELVARHTAARGGTAAIESVHAIEIELQIEEPTYKASGVYLATRDGRMRIDVSIAGQPVFSEGLDGGRSWSWSPNMDCANEGSAQGAAALRHGMEFPFKLFGLHEMQGQGHRLKLLDREVVDNIDYYLLQLTLDDGFEVRYYLNPETWLIERERQLRALHVDVDPTPHWIEDVFSDYRTVNGVQFPYRQLEHRLDTGEMLMTTTITMIRTGTDIEPERLKAP